MRDRGKALDSTNNNNNGDLFFHDDSAAYLPCKRHPSSSPPVGICPHCLKERLLTLLCSDCGEQRLSSCSCGEISPNRASHSSNSNLELGSVGRVSFLIENDAQSQPSCSLKRSNSSKPPLQPSSAAAAEVLILKRSSSSCVEIKRRKGGFWKIGRFFTRRSKDKVGSGSGNGIPHSVAGIEDRNGDLWVLDGDYAAGGGCGGMVSRSRSLCSFRGGGGGGGFFAGSEDGTYSGARSSVSGARSSISAARSSGFNGLVFDPDRKSGYSESEPRKSGFDVVENQKRDYPIQRGFSLREGNFTTAVDDSGFIDLKFDFQPPSDSKPPPTEAGEYGMAGGDGNGGSFRVSVSDRGIKRSRKSFKSWRWIFRQHHHNHHHQQHNHSSSSNHDNNNHHLGVKGEQNNVVNSM
ncbi:unnamed protein product [Linum trigynum]|uniref:Uncharacterized protein n=1 Tax=Linum trigynum TaxID=586398 RepID=A0AAV2F2Y5_9ROSI